LLLRANLLIFSAKPDEAFKMVRVY
jgi:hypothetical protein